jgi:tRNA A-37 threonylcarbamoyl transferase component Bud32
MCNTLKIGRLRYSRFDSDGWKGWVCEGFEKEFEEIGTLLSENSRNAVVDALCRRVAKHERPGGNYYSKLMWAQNDGALQKKELFSLLKWALGPARSVTILKNTSKMLEKGHLCPKPLLGIRQRKGNGHHLNLIVTTEVTAPTIEDVIQKRSEGEAEQAVRQAGCDLARLHADHFLHGDYLPRNACFSEQGTVFLDNDKTSRWPFMPPWFLRRRNLEQFVYNLMLQKGLKECHLELPTIFWEAYANEAKVAENCRGTIFDGIVAKCRKRWENKVKRTITS